MRISPKSGCELGTRTAPKSSNNCSRIEVAAVRPGAAPREGDLPNQPSVSGGVTGVGDPEHAAAYVDHLLVGARDGSAHLAGCDLRVVVRRAHRSSPRISIVGLAPRAASSASAMARSRLTPSGIS